MSLQSPVADIADKLDIPQIQIYIIVAMHHTLAI